MRAPHHCKKCGGTMGICQISVVRFIQRPRKSDNENTFLFHFKLKCCLFHQSMPARNTFPFNNALQACGINNLARDHVRIHVGGRATIFKVSSTRCFSGSRDSNRCSTVRDTIAKFANVSGLVSSSQTVVVAGSNTAMCSSFFNGSFLMASRITLQPPSSRIAAVE